MNEAEWPFAEVGRVERPAKRPRFECEIGGWARESASAGAGLQLDAKEQWRVEPKVETELGDWTVDKDFAQVLAGGHKHSL